MAKIHLKLVEISYFFDVLRKKVVTTRANANMTYIVEFYNS